MGDSLATELAILVAMTAMGEGPRLAYLSIIARVRRLEIFVDEVVGDASEDVILANSAGSDTVVFVNFAAGARG